MNKEHDHIPARHRLPKGGIHIFMGPVSLLHITEPGRPLEYLIYLLLRNTVLRVELLDD